MSQPVPGPSTGIPEPILTVLRRFAPIPAFRWWARRQGVPFRFPLGRVRWGNLRRVEPLSRHFGAERGTPIDRYYIEGFLARHAADVRGRVLEVKDAAYTQRFGGTWVSRSDVLDIDPTNAEATIVADLADGAGIPSDAFDCIILTQVLQLVFDVPAAIQTLYRALRPGGVLLVTVPGISQLHYEALGHTWYWSFTEASVRRLLTSRFPPDGVTVTPHGNVLAAAGLLYGVVLEEIGTGELDRRDPDYQVTLAARAVKRAGDA
jgi:SAM-dependent methyltransferase